MSCGKKPRKLWDHPKKLRTVTASKYEQNAPRTIDYWKNVLSELETSYLSTEKFWETTGNQVHGLVGDLVYERLRKIFNLPQNPNDYKTMDDASSLVSSVECYKERGSSTAHKGLREAFSMTDLSPDTRNDATEDFDDDSWSASTEQGDISKDHLISSKEHHITKYQSHSKSGQHFSLSSNLYGKSRSSNFAKKNSSSRTKSIKSISRHSGSEIAQSKDDLLVHDGDFLMNTSKKQRRTRPSNPYHQMLYCNESETDMIKWNSNYKAKRYVTSASDKTGVLAELKTKQIAKEFFDWWITLGTADVKSEIRKSEDIEALFQIWFEEHASQNLILEHKVIPCVLKSIAHYINATECSCKKMLEKYLSWDIAAESVPSKTVAFGASLPTKMKQIPPKNNTDKTWNCVKVPEDLRSMACVWEDIQHLTATKSFKAWLDLHPKQAVPPVLQTGKLQTRKKKSLFSVASDVMLIRETSSSEVALTLPFSQVNIELKDVLSKLLNQ